MKILRMITLILSVISGIYILFYLLLRIFVMIHAKTNAATLISSIGIIGGSDGPTAIFVATRPSLWAVSPIIIFLISVISNIFLRIKIKKSNKT